MNFYAILGVPRDADEEMIRSAYRLLARRYHPDRGVGSCSEKFREVKEAYETLIDSGSRHAYDLSLLRAESPISVRVEPISARSGLFQREDAGVFGRVEHPLQGFAHAPHSEIEAFFEEWLYSLDDFFGRGWPW